MHRWVYTMARLAVHVVHVRYIHVCNPQEFPVCTTYIHVVLHDMYIHVCSPQFTSMIFIHVVIPGIHKISQY
jgi:hypothetical protein